MFFFSNAAMHKLSKYLVSAATLVAMSSLAIGQTTISEWNYNALSGALDASTGTGTATGSSFPFTNTLPNSHGSDRDPGTFVDATGGGGGAGINNAPHSRSGPRGLSDSFGQTPSGTTISSWTTNASGFTNITMSFDMIQNYRMSRFYQILASTDGINFSAPTGTGSSVTEPGIGSVTVSDSGLMTVILEDGYAFDASLDPVSPIQYLELISYSFSAAYDNAADFSVQISTIFDPSGTDYVSSFAGTNDTDLTAGFSRSGGTRYDLVNISGVPEPSTIAAVMGAIALGLVMYRRRR